MRGPVSRVAFATLAVIGSACAGGWTGSPAPEGANPAAVADQLLAADRAFAAASERTDIATALAPMFAADVVMPVPGGFAVGKDSVLATIRANPASAGARVGWTPVRVGVSADGLQGFTLGYATVHGADGSSTPAKYLTYWVKGSEGWRAVVYRRARAAGQGRAAFQRLGGDRPLPPESRYRRARLLPRRAEDRAGSGVCSLWKR